MRQWIADSLTDRIFFEPNEAREGVLAFRSCQNLGARPSGDDKQNAKRPPPKRHLRAIGFFRFHGVKHTIKIEKQEVLAVSASELLIESHDRKNVLTTGNAEIYVQTSSSLLLKRRTGLSHYLEQHFEIESETSRLQSPNRNLRRPMEFKKKCSFTERESFT